MLNGPVMGSPVRPARVLQVPGAPLREIAPDAGVRAGGAAVLGHRLHFRQQVVNRALFDDAENVAVAQPQTLQRLHAPLRGGFFFQVSRAAAFAAAAEAVAAPEFNQENVRPTPDADSTYASPTKKLRRGSED